LRFREIQPRQTEAKKMSIFTNEEWARLIKEAKKKQREQAESERKKKEFESEHFGVTEEEYAEINRKVDEEFQAEQEQERLRIEEENKPKQVQIEYKITVENKTETKQESEESPIFEWIRAKKKKEESDKA